MIYLLSMQQVNFSPGVKKHVELNEDQNIKHAMALVKLRWLSLSVVASALPDVDLVVDYPVEGELYPCGMFHPSFRVIVDDDVAFEINNNRSWLLCFSVKATTCTPVGTKTLHSFYVEEPGHWTLKVWFTFLIDATSHRETGAYERHFSTECERKERNSFLDCTWPLAPARVALGALSRLTVDDGALAFPTFDGEPPARDLFIVLRLAPRSVASLERKYKNKRYDDATCPETSQYRIAPQLTVILALARTLDKLTSAQKLRTKVLLLPNGFQDNLCVGEWLKRRLPTDVAVEVDAKCPSGNAASFEYQTNKLSDEISDTAVIVALEDDVVLQPTALVEIIEIFASHDPCVVNPIDSPLLYTGDAHQLGMAYSQPEIVAGRRRHWRTAPSTTTTFATTAANYRRLASLDLLPDPQNDLHHSVTLSSALPGSIVSPLPGLASPIERVDLFAETHLAFFFDYLAYAHLLLDTFDLFRPIDDDIPTFLSTE